MLRPHAPWYDDTIRKAKQTRRQAERKWRKSKLTVNEQIFKDCQKEVSRLCQEGKTRHLTTEVLNNENDPKALFGITNKMLGKVKEKALPSHGDEEELANQFATFFNAKIAKIREDFSNIKHNTNEISQIAIDHKFSKFNPISVSDLEKLILTGNSKSCSLDPVPTSLLKQISTSIIPTIHTIVNNSLHSSHMPAQLKEAIVTPILKKSSLDSENLKNYRPVSNLPYLGKVIEKVAVNQLTNHLTENNLHESLQSAYQANHSTETALVKVSNDILLALDKGQCVYLVLLDLSAAFDTIDHSVFLSRLEKDNAVTNDALEWMRSYLTERKQCVKINSTTSENTPLKFGFPQGSTIGPFGFKLYTKSLTSIAQKHGINIHLYADDTQLYTSFNPKDSEQALERLEACVEDIRRWMSDNFLKLNDSKTEFLILGSQNNLTHITGWTLTVGDTEIFPTECARNIGAFMDSSLNMKTHINNTVRSCYMQIHSISKIRKYLSIEAAKTLVHAFVTSRLDNLNSLLIHLPDSSLKKLQKVQNNAAKLIIRKRTVPHITPVLYNLHWLPVTFRIKYKILLLVFKCFLGIAPSYLSSLIQSYVPTYPLRSSSAHKLNQSIRTKKKYGDRAFSVCGPDLWNKLPKQLRECHSVEHFKTKLKTHLFESAFSSFIH